MRFSSFFCPTLKETPKEAEVVSHQLMMRAGMIRKVASGIYAYLPLGLRVLRKFESIVREEMERSGAIEVSLPSVIPAQLWEKTGRWTKYGKELLRIKDRHDNEFCYGPTHEEVITDLASYAIRSYKQLPLNLFQIQTKFRDEIRPRFGLMRGREFTMKDAYSFHETDQCLDKTYNDMRVAYQRIFSRCGLTFREVHADSGAIGGSESAEFMVVAATGEDEILVSSNSDFASNVEAAPTLACPASESENHSNIEDVHTPDSKTIEEVSSFLKCGPENCIKSLVFHADDNVVLVLIRGDHDVSETKLQSYLGVDRLEKVTDNTIFTSLGSHQGYIGPVNLAKQIDIYVDHSLDFGAAFVVGANKEGYHLKNMVISRDLSDLKINVGDFRSAKAGDVCPVDSGTYESIRGIEVGHVFKLGKLYAEALDASFLNENGKSETMTMGCYGIGVGRSVAAAIEQNHDDKGIIWPASLAPFEVVVIPIGKDDQIKDEAERLYQELLTQGIDVLLDDRPGSPGVKFKDAELMGIPIQCIVGRTFTSQGKYECVTRHDNEKNEVDASSISNWLKETLTQNGS